MTDTKTRDMTMDDWKAYLRQEAAQMRATGQTGIGCLIRLDAAGAMAMAAMLDAEQATETDLSMLRARLKARTDDLYDLSEDYMRAMARLRVTQVALTILATVYGGTAAAVLFLFWAV